MSIFNTLKALNLLCWDVMLIGFKKNWINRDDISDYAVELLLCDENDENVILIASCNFYDDSEVLSLLGKLANNQLAFSGLDRWRLASLVNISNADLNDQKKMDLLQEVYSRYDYPYKKSYWNKMVIYCLLLM